MVEVLRTHAYRVQYGANPSSSQTRACGWSPCPILSREESSGISSASRTGRAHLQLDAPDDQPLGRDERSASWLGAARTLSTDSRALVDARAVGRLQVREDLIARRWLWRSRAWSRLAVWPSSSVVARNWSSFARSTSPSRSRRRGRGLRGPVFLTYLMQIESWRAILAGWVSASRRSAAHLERGHLGRYVPEGLGASPAWCPGPAGRRRAGQPRPPRS